jgi:hypothetical protein
MNEIAAANPKIIWELLEDINAFYSKNSYSNKNNLVRKNKDSSEVMPVIDKTQIIKHTRESNSSKPTARANRENQFDYDNTLPRLASLNSAELDFNPEKNFNIEEHIRSNIVKKNEMLSPIRNIHLNENNLTAIANCLGIEKTRARRKIISPSSIINSNSKKNKNNKLYISPITSNNKSNVSKLRPQTTRYNNNPSNTNKDKDCFVIFKMQNLFKFKKKIDSSF